MKIWIAVWNNESGDRGVTHYWTEKPTKEVLHEYFEIHHSGDYDKDGGRYIYWELEELRPIK